MNFKLSPLAHSVIALSVASIAPAAQSAVLEEVMVTAQKRAQSVNDIGVSASALSGDGLKALGIEQSSDLGAMTPGLVTVNATSGGTPVFAIRGIGLDDYNANNTSGVGVYTDEVFASSPAYLSGQLFDIERVEVLKGPQGTLYGKNTTGGAINFISNKPTEQFEASVEAGYGSHKTSELTGVISGPITNGLRGRLAANIVKSDEGWQQDAATGKEYGIEDRYAVRGQLAFDINDNGAALLRAYRTEDNSISESPHSEGAEAVLGDASYAALNSSSNPRKVSVGNLDVGRDETGSGASLAIHYDFAAFSFISISSFDEYQRVVLDNYDGSAASTTDLFLNEELKQWAQELRLVSNSEGPFTWVAGVNASYEEVVEMGAYFDDSYLVTDSVTTHFVHDPADLNANGLDRFIASYEQETDSYGAYIHTETELNDSFKLIVGARYSNDDRSFKGTSSEDFFGSEFILASLDDSEQESAVTGKIGVDWQANDELLVFTNVATSYKSGSFYGAPIVDSNSWAYTDPEEIVSYELGFKWQLLEGSMQLNGSVYRMEYENRQSLINYVSDDYSNSVAFSTLDTTLINVPESTTQGFELDMEWLATDALSIRAGVAYLDAKITKAPGISELRGISNDINANANATGDANFNFVIDGSEVGFVEAIGAPISKGLVLAQSPEWSYNASVAYEINVSNDLVARLQTSYSWVDDQFASLGDSNGNYGPVKSLNAQASIGADDERWLLTLWGRNISDEASETYSFSGFAGRTVYRQQPATYGVTFNYRFD